MIARLLLRGCVGFRNVASTSAAPPKNIEKKSIYDITQGLLAEPPSRLPNFVFYLKEMVRRKWRKDGLDPMLKSLIDGAATQLYYDCANKYDYEKLCLDFFLRMALMRAQISLEGNAYIRWRHSFLATLWHDVDNRLKIVGEEINATLTRKSDLLHMHGLYLQTFFEYDEGFLADDVLLAAALWRCLYLSRSCDPMHVLNAVVYIRSTMAWLDTIDIDELMVNGIKEWKQVKPKDAISHTEDVSEEINEKAEAQIS
ncbi:Ubiquinol-cytochrome C chaperone [Dictyocaulus viviparus]|uniref:Ubiquinol-cytochrome C chaperone n=1 Tax=Dictyocaulus viviparus TaxID=29172 RepID=A0A0D8XJB4_DICVI|nr:Ubiquinol-cytochrome C chaperone [Dictyocaulus viviparus]